VRVSMLVMSCAALGAAVPVLGQEYPSRPVRMVVGYAAGGTTDFTARVVGPKFSETLGQPVVVDNRPGAGSLIGTELVAKATPDGHTLLMADTTFGIVPAVRSDLPFDVARDFAPIMHIISVANALAIHPSVAATSVKELVALAKTKPGQLTFGSGGVGTPLHMAGEQLKVAAKVDMTHVAYKGAAPAIADLLGGNLTMVFPTLTVGVPHIKAGKLRALAVTSAKRAPALPAVPTLTEEGYPQVNATSWFGLVAPAKTPRAVVDRIRAALAKVVDVPEVRVRFESQHAEVIGGSPEQFRKFLAGEIAQWKAVAKAGKIKTE
jgi:tripartite-type tricarboxylate transporter receptor subunit TctC